MYSLANFGMMIDDRVRLNAYTEALRRSITPDSVVLDIGAGTGILSLIACRLGARRVYALEPSPFGGIIHEAARANGFSDRITVLTCKSSAVTLPEQADVIVSDLHGVLPVFHTALADLADARTRLLAPGGTIIPAVEPLYMAVVSAAARFERLQRPWRSRPEDLVLDSALRYASNAWMKHRAEPEDLLTDAFRWSTLDYRTIANPRVAGAGELIVRKGGTGHGLLLWFDSQLCTGVGFSNAPGAQEAIYGQAYFPWLEAVDLHEGDVVHVDVRADPIADRYQWTWSTEIRRAAGPTQRFRQSEFLGTPLSPEVLQQRAAGFSPKLSTDGEMTLRALERFREGATLGAVADELHGAAPRRFATPGDALDFVADLAGRLAT